MVTCRRQITFVGKTRHSFRQRWHEHLTYGVNHKVRAVMEEGIWSDITEYVLLDFMLVPAEYRTYIESDPT